MIAHAGIIDHVFLASIALGSVVAYFVAWRGVRQPSLSGPIAWSAAWTVLLASTSPVMESAAERSFTGHMVQHLMMILVAAPLLALASPFETLGEALHHSDIRMGASSRHVLRAWRSIGPIAAPLAFVTVLLLTHLTGIYDLALTSRLVHDLEHFAYVGTAAWLWSVMRRGRPAHVVQRIAAVFGVIAGSSLLGAVLLSAESPIVATYAQALGRRDALADQRAAASLMWVGGMGTSLPLLILVFWRWASTEDRVARHSEHLVDSRRRSSAPTRIETTGTTRFQEMHQTRPIERTPHG